MGCSVEADAYHWPAFGRCEISEGLLTILRNDESAVFSRVATGDEFWFPYPYQSTHCYATSREEVRPRTKSTIAPKRTMVTIFFTGTKLLVLGIVSREEKFNQNHFLAVIAPELSKENSDAKRRIDTKQLVVHMDKSMRHNWSKIQYYFDRNRAFSTYPFSRRRTRISQKLRRA